MSNRAHENWNPSQRTQTVVAGLTKQQRERFWAGYRCAHYNHPRTENPFPPTTSTSKKLLFSNTHRIHWFLGFDNCRADEAL